MSEGNKKKPIDPMKKRAHAEGIAVEIFGGVDDEGILNELEISDVKDTAAKRVRSGRIIVK